MEIKRCLLTKTTNDSTFAIYPKTSADLVVLDQNTEEKLIDRLNNNGIWQNKTFYDGLKVAKGTVGAGDESVDIASIGGSWWAQTKGANYGTAPSLIVHQRRLIEQKDNDGNRTVSPTIRLQNYITYNHNGNPTTNNGVTTYKGEQMCRVTSALHETIADGEAWSSDDDNTANFTPVAIISYNKFKGPVGMNAIFGRVEDVYYTDQELNGNSASKSCAGAFYATRLSNYSQGKNGTSYSIGIETWTDNQAQEDGLLGTQGYYGASDFFSYKTWTCGYHLIGGGRRPITAGILINGSTTSADVYQTGIDTNGEPIYSDLNDVNGDPLYTGTKPNYEKKTLENGMYNGIVIRGSSMAIGGKNSKDTVGINMASWTQSKFYGYTAIRIGYAPRFLTGRGPAYFEAPSFKFLNMTNDLYVGLTAGNKKSTHLLFKTINENNTNIERPDDTIRAKISYYNAIANPNSSYLTFSSDNDIRFATKCTFVENSIESNDNDDNTKNVIENQDANDAAVYKFKNDKFFGTLPYYTSKTYPNTIQEYEKERIYPTLGTTNYLWQKIYLKDSPIVVADEKVFKPFNDDGTTYSMNINDLRRWGNIPMNECVYRRYVGKDDNDQPVYKIYFCLTKQKYDTVADNNGDVVEDSTQYFEKINDINDQNSKLYAIDYNQCFVIEAAYNRLKHTEHDEAISSITTDITNIKQQVYENGTSNETTLIAMVNDLRQKYEELYNMIEALTNTDQNNTVLTRLNNIETSINSIESDIETLNNGLETTNILMAQYHPDVSNGN